MKAFFSQSNLIKAAIIVGVLAFVVPMLLGQAAVQKLVAPLGRMGGLAVQMFGVLLALFIARKVAA